MTPVTSPARDRLSQGEFVALTAMLFATIAFSIDGLLPAEPAITAALTPDDPNRAKLVVGMFFLGLGGGTLFTGPLSDAFGRKRVIIWGGAVYSVAAFICWLTNSLDVLLAGRVLQGIGAAAPRTVGLAMVRDLYSGRNMARIMSFAMTIFVVAPAAAPLLGQQIILLAGWPAMFLVFIAFSMVSILWLGIRQPETLPPERRRRLSTTAMLGAVREIACSRIVVVSILIQCLTQGIMIATISSVQGIFHITFDMEQSFPLWFAGAAVVSGAASFLNARIVMTLGMRRVITLAYAGVLVTTMFQLGVTATGALPDAVRFPIFYLWLVSIFSMMGLTMGNLNALAMEPVGHIAGMAASVIAAVSTVLAVVISTPIAQAFDGTDLPLVAGALACVVAIHLLLPFLRE